MSAEPVLSSRPLAFDRRAIDKRVGLILLGTDHSTEADFARLVACDRVGLFATRVEYANPVTPENLAAMEPRLTSAAAMILPEEDLDVVCFSCSSASVVIGDEAVEAAIRRGKPDVPVVTPPLATVEALRALGARRISVLTPYTVETSRPMAAYFERAGFDIASFACLGLTDDREMARVSRETLVNAAAGAASRDADALFISCTALRAASVAERIEERIGRPAVTSNQATAWACLNRCSIAPKPGLGAGRLFGLPANRAA